MSLNDHLVAMSETQPWTSFALRGLNFQFLELNFQFLEGNFKMSEPCDDIGSFWIFHVRRAESTLIFNEELVIKYASRANKHFQAAI
jgi:hypothetical protein